MTDALKLAEQQLLAPGGLSHTDLEKVLNHLMGPSVDSGDLYFQNTSHEAWALEDGLVRSGTHAVEQGVGIRAISGEKTGFAYADEIIMLQQGQLPSMDRRVQSRPGNARTHRLYTCLMTPCKP
jgi:TldD protein